MDLVIDIGNTKAKIALYDKDSVVERFSYNTLAVNDLREVLSAHNSLQRAILATTRAHDQSLEQFLASEFDHFVVFDPAHTPTPLVNTYLSPSTLGADRLAAAVAANDHFPESEILLFDLGTALTIDRVSACGRYLGGNISPGMAMRFEILNRSTACLPLCRAKKMEWEVEFARDTQNAIIQGVTCGIVLEIEGYIARFMNEKPDGKIFFTGGDALYFEKRIKNTIFVDNDAVLNGLHMILDY
ncbi:MAG: type III pantothenate kinase [Mucinivorans sp.]